MCLILALFAMNRSLLKRTLAVEIWPCEQCDRQKMLQIFIHHVQAIVCMAIV